MGGIERADTHRLAIRMDATPDVLRACGAPPSRPLALNWPNNSDGKAIVGNMGTGALHLDHTLEDQQDLGRLDNEFQDRPQEDLANQSWKKGKLRRHHHPRNPDVRNNCNTGCATWTEKNLGPLQASQTVECMLSVSPSSNEIGSGSGTRRAARRALRRGGMIAETRSVSCTRRPINKSERTH